MSDEEAKRKEREEQESRLSLLFKNKNTKQKKNNKKTKKKKELPYKWSQTLSDVTVLFEVPVGTKGKDLDIVIKRDKIKAGLKGKPPVIEVNFLVLFYYFYYFFFFFLYLH